MHYNDHHTRNVQLNKLKNKLLNLLQVIANMSVITVSLKEVINRALSGLYLDDCPYKDNFADSYNQFYGHNPSRKNL